MIHILKKHAFPIFVLLLIALAVPFTVSQIQNYSTFRTKASEFSLVPYPGLEWSSPKEYTISNIDETSEEPKVIMTKGMAVTAVTNENKSSAVYSFYDKLLQSKGFTITKLTGDPEKETHWVARYTNEGNEAQVQYFPTPYKNNEFTILLFYGVNEK